MCVSPSGKWVAVGLATGHLSLIDIRTGVLISHWRAHEGEVLQLVTVNEKVIVSSSLDQTVLAWSTVDGKLKCQLKCVIQFSIGISVMFTYYIVLFKHFTEDRLNRCTVFQCITMNLYLEQQIIA